ncbi:Fe-S protein assembly chaperone HscA [Alcaligenaceae bacterium LF4-65]|uniref:Chaperone protein HscA homolog n=1 Tax=Zwartia hollandica TaxID=324606 RepID=A0A953N791_9BURK|nr:Fe-S protein assembly chaperone HscA [Zwartia hollandica]MBZ1349318.1 Fe-S protein assembly chaperone HscA [Zwartia hollandica]
MALLQISEPGESPAPHQRRLAVGIDLGTTHSLVAAVRSSVPEVLPDEQGRMLVPSAVYYEATDRALVGVDALAQQAAHPLDTLVSIKRFMGRSYDDAAASDVPYVFVADGQSVRIQTAHATVSPVEVAARILDKLKYLAEGTLGDSLVGAVITVPAYFDDAQRQATRDAARLAGLNVLRLLNEPTAAAIAYGLDHGSEGVYAVYDLGGGTFDLSLLRLTRGVFEVIATGGDTRLGGDDFDALIVAYFTRTLCLNDLSPGSRRAMLSAARVLREGLTERSDHTVNVTLEGVRLALSLTRQAFEAMASSLIERTLDCARLALKDASLSVKDINGVVMVGGATRMPIVRKSVGAFFGSEPLIDLNPDEVVALGAALQANLLAGNRNPGEDWLLLDVTPLTLGLETMGGLVEHIIPRNSTIPVARAQEFTTFKDGQTALAVHVVQGERDLVADCRSLARFELRGIPPMVAGAAKIRVTFQVDADGLLSVTARELGSGVEASVTVKPSYGLSDEEVARMLTEGLKQADYDARMRMLKEQQVDAQQLIESVRAAMATDADLLSAAEQTRIAQQLQTTAQAASEDDVEQIRLAIKALSDATDDFAAKRMDRSIRAALTGKSLDAL